MQALAPSFEAATVKLPAPGSGLSCSGGPGTDSPGIWRCTNMPLALVIAKAFGFKEFQFSVHDPCCVKRFDFIAKIAPGTTPEAFEIMLQNLLRERFGFAFHYETKEMPVYRLAVSAKGSRLRPSSRNGPKEQHAPWWLPPKTETDPEGYPVFVGGGSGLASGWGGRFRWRAFDVSIQEVASTLSGELGRPVIDATGLKGKYDLDLKWVVESEWRMNERARAEVREQVGEVPEGASGPTLVQAVRDRLGLTLKPTRGAGQVVAIDHLEKLPRAN